MWSVTRSGKYYLIATDLSIFHRKDWESVQYRGSRDLMVWESEDLVRWSGPRSHTVGVEGAGCVWAPEAVWDEEKQAFLVFFASMTRLSGEEQAKQRIYAAYTQDFSAFTPTELYVQAENHLIDTTIVRENGWYYRFTKDETTKKILMERLRGLQDRPDPVPCEALANLPGVEGSECYQLPDGRWCLIVDQFSTGKGYLPLVADTLASGNFQKFWRDQGAFRSPPGPLRPHTCCIFCKFGRLKFHFPFIHKKYALFQQSGVAEAAFFDTRGKLL